MFSRPHHRSPAAGGRSVVSVPLLSDRLRAAGLTLALAAALCAAMPAPSAAHLAIIRQGGEAGGAIEGGDQVGGSLAVGDFNGDGYDDLAIGSPGENVSDLVDAGAVVVSIGSKSGITQFGSYVIWATSTGFTSQPDAHYGFSVATGDFNHDGYSDLVVGAPFEDVDGKADAGRVYLYYGGASGLSATAAVALSEADAGGVVETGDRFGYAMAAGNFDGDAVGYDDLAVGAPGKGGAGAVVVNLTGGPLGLSALTASTLRQSDLGGTNVSGDEFGSALAAGNIAGTAAADLAVGSPHRAAGGHAQAGVVYLVRGSLLGLVADSSSTVNSGDLDSTQTNARFGSALAAGHFFSGSYTSVAIGEPGRTVHDSSDAGRVLALRGGPGGFVIAPANVRVLTQDLAGGVVQRGDLFGSAIAAGPFGAPNAYDELGIGSPGDGLGVTTGAGLFQVFRGTASGPGGGTGAFLFTQATCDDRIENGDHFGASVAFGRFDATDEGGFAVGAPFEDSEGAYDHPDVLFDDAGQVHIIAPWHQVYGLTAKSAVQSACDGEVLFSVRPFDRTPIDGTTRIMTVLLACQHVAGGLDPDTPYTIPSWVADDAKISGSQCLPDLVAGETVTLRDLLYTCLRFSADDAALAIADVAEGGGGASDWSTFVTNESTFVAEMNVYADTLEMKLTNFSNPTGHDRPLAWLPGSGSQFSTAWDLWLLGRAAMKDTLFSRIAGLEAYAATRGGVICSIPPGYPSNYGSARVAGLEDGGAGQAEYAAVFSAQPPTVYGQPVGAVLGLPPGDARFTEPTQLMNLSLGLCEEPLASFAHLPIQIDLPGIPTADSVQTLLAAPFGQSREGAVDYDLFRTSGGDPAAVDLEIGRRAEALVSPGPGKVLGVAPFQAHTGFVISNLDSIPVHLLLTPSAGAGPLDTTVPVDSFVSIAAYASPSELPAFTLTIEALGPAPALLSVREDYTFQVTGIGAETTLPVFTTRLTRASSLDDGFWVRVTGRGPADGSTMYLAIHDTTSAAGVPRPGPGAGTLALRLLPPVPNPFSGQVRLAGEIARAGRVGVSIFDLQGRAIRRLPERSLPAGRFEFQWDGSGQDGRPAGTGLYWYRASLDGRPMASGRLILAR